MGSVRDMAAVGGHVHMQARVCMCGVSTRSQLTPLWERGQNAWWAGAGRGREDAESGRSPGHGLAGHPGAHPEEASTGRASCCWSLLAQAGPKLSLKGPPRTITLLTNLKSAD